VGAPFGLAPWESEGQSMTMRSISLAAALGAVALVLMNAGDTRAAAPAANTPQARVEAAYAAMGMTGQYQLDGGAQARETLVTVTSRGSMQQWDPGESRAVADLMVPDWGTSTFVQRWDRSKEMVRTDWVRPRAGGGTRTFSEIAESAGGYVIGNDVNGAMPQRTIQGTTPLHTMSGLRLRAIMRELERTNIVLEMYDNPERVSNLPAQTVDGKTYPAVQFQGEHGTFIVMFDPATSFPAIVRTRDFDYLMGDANFDATMSDWRPVRTFRMPHRITYTLNGVKVFDTTYSAHDINGPLPADAFVIPAPLRGKAVAAAPIADTPYQWILRRLASGFYLDADALYSDDGASIQLTDVAPNMSLATGGSHNTLIVATPQYLVAFDSPGDDGLSQRVIDMAKAKYPGRSFRYLVLTHHHYDHTGGLRAYVADGATVVVGKGNGAFFQRTLSAPQELNRHKPQRPIAPRVVEVDGKWSVNDGGRVVEAHALETPHAAGYVIPYVPDAKMAFVTDLWNPGPMVPPTANPLMTSIVRGMEKAGLQPEKFAGGHGSVGNYADLVRVVGPAR
jgi:glyoxylase-like metal-dependent hydrolase (beta-lactamase superfamily II)